MCSERIEKKNIQLPLCILNRIMIISRYVLSYLVTELLSYRVKELHSYKATELQSYRGTKLQSYWVTEYLWCKREGNGISSIILAVKKQKKNDLTGDAFCLYKLREAGEEPSSNWKARSKARSTDS